MVGSVSVVALPMRSTESLSYCMPVTVQIVKGNPPVHRDQFSLTKGEPCFWQTLAESGNSKLCAFCGVCGSRVYHAEDHQSGILSLKAGLLGGIRDLRPVAHLWLRSAQPWINIDGHQFLTFEKEPDDYDPLIKRWQQKERPLDLKNLD